MAFDFPANPTVNDEYASGGVNYIWTGEVWSFSPDASSVPHVLRPGDTMTGVLKLVPPNPVAPEDAAHKAYVDQAVATLSLWQGVWSVAANTPDLTPAVAVPMHGYTWTAKTVDPQVPELAPAALPGIGGVSIASNDTIVYNDSLLAYEHIPTPNTASSIYIADIKPAAPFPGQLWWDSDSGKHYCYYTDADSGQWVQISGGGGGNPTGIADDAPSDMVQYARQSPTIGGVVAWTPVTAAGGVAEAPVDGTPYSRQDAAWVAAGTGVGVIPDDAPSDTQQYVRQSATVGGVVAWTVVSAAAPIADAPADGTPYSRQDAAWVSATVGGGIPDAPNDGQQYARQSISWTPIISALASVGDTPPVTAPQGTLWFNSNDGSLYVYFDDGTSGQWVEVTGRD